MLEDLNNEVAAGQTLEDLALRYSISIELVEIENNELPDRFNRDRTRRHYSTMQLSKLMNS